MSLLTDVQSAITTLQAAVATLDDLVNARNVLTLAPTLDTSAYVNGDVLFATTEMADAYAAAGARLDLMNVTVLDKDDNGLSFDLLFFDSAINIGDANAAASPSDADLEHCLGSVSILATDYIDVGGAKLATITNVNLPLLAAEASTSLWVGGVIRSAGTYSAGGLRFKLGMV